jgi:hypothetical protein
MFSSQFHIDTLNIADYHLRAGLHCQSVLTDRYLNHIRTISSEEESCVHTSFPPVAVGREWDTFECAGVQTSPSTCFRSATIIYNVSAELHT